MNLLFKFHFPEIPDNPTVKEKVSFFHFVPTTLFFTFCDVDEMNMTNCHKKRPTGTVPVIG